MKFEWDFSAIEKFATNLSSLENFDENMKKATKDISKALLKWMKSYTPYGETHQLINGWNGNAFLVTKKDNGFEVLIVNKDAKATWVNDGHRVKNQADGEYLKVHRRVQVPTAHEFQTNASEWYVFGHFFVERGILRLNDTKEIEQIIMRELEKWWEGCF